jgi:ATP-dependent helicase/nuclease subunit B
MDMASIHTQQISSDRGPADLWACVAAATRAWLDAHSIARRDVILLVPFAELLSPARHAFACSAGWLPRIHTTSTLARECPPSVGGMADPAAPTGDAAFDRLGAARLRASRPGRTLGA